MKLSAVLFTALALGLTACGGGGGEATTTPASTTPPATDSAPSADTAPTGGGGGGGEYPAEVEKNYVTSCEGAGAEAETCKCMFDYIQKNIPFDEFAKADAEVAQGGQPPAFVQEAQQACA